jgi:hypothetical protein
MAVSPFDEDPPHALKPATSPNEANQRAARHPLIDHLPRRLNTPPGAPTTR